MEGFRQCRGQAAPSREPNPSPFISGCEAPIPAGRMEVHEVLLRGETAKGIRGPVGEGREVIRVSMKERIKGWLVEEEILVEEVQDAGSRFRFLVMFPKDHYMELVQPLTGTDLVLVLSPTSVSPEHREIMEKARPEQRAEFIWALRFVMNTFPVDFEMEHPENILAKFTITDLIYEDGLSKDRLMASIRKVWKANLQVIWILQKEYGVAGPGEKEPGTEGISYM